MIPVGIRRGLTIFANANMTRAKKFVQSNTSAGEPIPAIGNNTKPITVKNARAAKRKSMIANATTNDGLAQNFAKPKSHRFDNVGIVTLPTVCIFANGTDSVTRGYMPHSFPTKNGTNCASAMIIAVCVAVNISP